MSRAFGRPVAFPVNNGALWILSMTAFAAHRNSSARSCIRKQSDLLLIHAIPPRGQPEVSALKLQ